MVRLRLALILFVGCLVASDVWATDLMIYVGSMNHSAVGGCCNSGGGRTGAGALGTLSLNALGDINLSVYSDDRWAEGLILKPFYLLGGPTRLDTGTGDQVRAVTLSNWRLVSSVGAGYFIHTTTTKKFILPTHVAGFVFSGINQLLYTIDDQWAAGAILQLSAGVSASDTSMLVGTFLTINYTFK